MIEADETPRRAVAGDLLERAAADEVARLGELDDAPQPGLVGVGVEVELVAVERHAGLEPERVARAEPDRQPAGRPDRVEQRVPERHRVGRVDEELEAVLAGVPGPGDRVRAIPATVPSVIA